MTGIRRGFTMIELIFVIVIIGILAAIALPKLMGTAEQARKRIYVSFMGTLNRTVGPTIWSDYISTGGSVVTVTEEILKDRYIDFPPGVTLNLTLCTSSDTPTAVGEISTDVLPIAETIYCLNGTPTESPKFGYSVDGNQTNQSFQFN